jgi:phage gp36-like protein
MYLTKADYKLRIATNLLDIILNQIEDEDEDILEMASKSAQDIIEAHVGHQYHIPPEWAKANLERNFQIINWCLDLALYFIYQRVADYEVPQKVIKNYDDTIETLEKVANGKLSVNLPPLPIADDQGNIPDTGYGLRRMGPNKPRNHKM